MMKVLGLLAIILALSDNPIGVASSPKGRAKNVAERPLPLPLTGFPRPGENGVAKRGNKVDLRSKDGEGELL